MEFSGKQSQRLEAVAEAVAEATRCDEQEMKPPNDVTSRVANSSIDGIIGPSPGPSRVT